MSTPTETRQESVGVVLLRIDEQAAEQRVDNFLLRHYKGVPRSHIYRVVRKGAVRVNKKRVRPAYKLQPGDALRLPPLRVAAERPRRPPDVVIARVEARVAYEDERVIVLNKPAGLAVHAGSNVEYGIIDALRVSREQPVYLAHRLDRGTSGCLLVAKDRPAMLFLQQSLRRGAMEKFYLALLMGAWGRGRQRVEMPIARAHSGRCLVRADQQGKSAASVFSPAREYARDTATAATLMKIRIITGRTHQIRVHAKAMGHPLAGDRRYGDDEFNRQMGALGLRRMFLHACELRFPHPDDERPITIAPPLDDDLHDPAGAGPRPEGPPLRQ